MAHEILVVDRERARAQRADQRQAVGRIVDRGEHPDQVAHLLALVEVARALVPVGDPGAGERVLVALDPGARRHQDRHVAPAARPPPIAVVPVPDLPPLLVRCVQQRGDRARLLAAQIVGLAPGVVLADGEHDRRALRLLGLRWRGERDVGGLHAGLLLEHLVEHGVERGEHLGV